MLLILKESFEIFPKVAVLIRHFLGKFECWVPVNSELWIEMCL